MLEIVDDRHGRASTVVTSQLPVAHWHIGNPTIADAVLDRLVHTPTESSLGVNHCGNCVPRKRLGLTRRLAPEPNVAPRRSCRYPCWLPSECLAGFNRNRWLVSIGSMAGFVGNRTQFRWRDRKACIALADSYRKLAQVIEAGYTSTLVNSELM